jgi:hypothetical protein
LLIVFLEPDILVKFGESQGEAKGIFNSLLIFKLAVSPREEVVTEDFYCKETLETAVEVAVVGIVL